MRSTRNLLDETNLPLLSAYARSRALLAFDFDGTLAPIVSEPHNAQMRPSTRECMQAVAERYPCAVISGRALPDLSQRLDGLPLVALIGNHGLEPDFASQSYAKLVLDHIPLMRERLDGLPEVMLEDKRYSISIHYRGANAEALVLPRIEALAYELRSVFRAIPGKQVMNLVPLGAPHKGTLLARLRLETSSESVLYAGDDVTDEDAFALDMADALLSVRIERSETTRAQYYLASQLEIDRLLERLIELRTGTGACHAQP